MLDFCNPYDIFLKSVLSHNFQYYYPFYQTLRHSLYFTKFYYPLYHMLQYALSSNAIIYFIKLYDMYFINYYSFYKRMWYIHISNAIIHFVRLCFSFQHPLYQTLWYVHSLNFVNYFIKTVYYTFFPTYAFIHLSSTYQNCVVPYFSSR